MKKEQGENCRKLSWSNRAAEWLLCAMTSILLFTCCYEVLPNPWLEDESKLDSLTTSGETHFTKNANFEVTVDSINIEDLLLKDAYITLHRGDHIVVAEVITRTTDTPDSVWVKVASSHEIQGWLPQTTLLRSCVPTDSISKLIHQFDKVNTPYLLGLSTLLTLLPLVYLKHRKRLHLLILEQSTSVYPWLFCLTAATSATIYKSIQMFYPEMWRSYYFNPTLSPFKLDFPMSLFIGSIWLLVILLIATIDDLFRKLPASTSFLYIGSMLAGGTYFYLLLLFTTPFYVGYLLLIAFILYLVYLLSYK